MRISRKILVTCAALFFFSQILFLINIQFPRGLNFDEFHYVPAAKQFLAWTEWQNWEHPPLGKYLMAAGIAIWGDRPVGWRQMSTLFGSFTLLGMYFWALALFRDRKIALWTALLTAVNQLLYVQARIGMLDTFMFAFIAWAMAAFCATWTSGAAPEREKESAVPVSRWLSTRSLLAFTGVCLGLATACKWFGVIPWAFCIGCVVSVRVLQRWQTRFSSAKPDDFYHPDLWRNVRGWDWVFYLGIIPVFVYFITFLPLLAIQHRPFDITEFIAMQIRMWDGQGRVVSSHPYMSTWSQWATLKRPIWYAFDKEGESVRGVLLLGNPWIMWTGLIAIAVCFWEWIALRRREAFLIFATYAAFYGSWIVIPRKVAFFYYYYPAGMVLSLALAYVMVRFDERRWIRWVFLAGAAAVFVYFFPISSALKIPSESFRKWMWLRSWI